MDDSQTVVLVSNNRMLRDVFATYLCKSCSLTVTTVDSANEVISHPLPRGAVIVLIRIGYEGRRSLNDVGEIRKRLPDNPVAIVSDVGDSDTLWRSLAMGVKGMISATAGAETLVHSLRVLLAGGEIISPRLLLDVKAAGDASVDARKGPTLLSQNRLTATQRDVLDLVLQGKPNKAIAAQLGLAEAKVKNHLRNLMRKTGTRNRVELALAALNRSGPRENEFDKEFDEK